MMETGQHRHHMSQRRLVASAALACCALAFVATHTSVAYAALTDAQTVTSILTFTQGHAAVTLTLDANGGTFAPEVAATFGGALRTDGTAFSYEDIAADTTLGTLPEPSREAHTFAGWWTEPTGGERIAIKVPEESTTYYAHWRHESLVFWALDGDGLLVVASNAEAAGRDRDIIASGSFDRQAEGYPGWSEQAERIVAVQVVGGVRPHSTERWFCIENSYRNHYDFAGYPNLASADLSGLDGSELTSMRAMFASCRALEQVSLGVLDTSHVTDMSWTFAYCPKLAALDLSSFDTSQVADMSYLLEGCTGLGRLATGVRWERAPRWHGLPSARLPIALTRDGEPTPLERGSELVDGAHAYEPLVASATQAAASADAAMPTIQAGTSAGLKTQQDR